MADNIEINDLIGKQLPPEILEQLKVLGRVEFKLKNTITSAVSNPSDREQDQVLEEDSGADTEREVDRLLNEVGILEGLVEDLENNIDFLTKDMAIPPATDTISNAAKALGSEDGYITQNVMNNALAIMDYLPLLTMGQDPELAALIGDGSVDGEWLECSQITRSIGALFKEKENQPKDKLQSENTKVAEDFEQKQNNMQIEILNMLFWNMLWPTFIVDLVILGPMRAVVNPIDAMILFFKRFPFRRPKKEQIKKNGPLNKLLNALRNILMCLPLTAKLYPRYKPPADVVCRAKGTCPEKPGAGTDTKEDDFKNPKKDKGLLGDLFPDDDVPCVSEEDIVNGYSPKLPQGLGVSPDCIKSAKVVLDAVLEDALTPPSGEESKLSQNLRDQVEGVSL